MKPLPESYIKAARFEDQKRNFDRARLFYERCVAELGSKAYTEEFFLPFTRFEIKAKEYERARVLFKFALDQIPKSQCLKLFENFVKFEKQFGTKEDMEEIVCNKRR